MSARAHLRLIVSEPAPTSEPYLDVVESNTALDRASLIQPISSWRENGSWLRTHTVLIALWSTTFVLLGITVLLLARRM
jgi:hypothetical protein